MIAAQFPKDNIKIVHLHNLQYKIGSHGLVFVWLNDQWTKSTKTPADLKPPKLKRIF